MVRMPMVKGKYIYIYAYIKFQIEPKEKYLQIRYLYTNIKFHDREM